MAARAKGRNLSAAPVPLASVFVLLAVVALLIVLGSTACGRVTRPATPAQAAASINVATTASASVPVATSAADEDVPRAELLRATNSFLQHLFERNIDALSSDVAFPLSLHTNSPRPLCAAALSAAELEPFVDCLLAQLPSQNRPRDLQTLTTYVYASDTDLSPYLARSAPARSDHFFSGGQYFHASGGTTLMLAFRRERPFVVRDVMLSQTVNL
jgi:hypothetical protein